ncbi:MAG: Na/Pi cotransporter family protein [Flavobacteriales bacterium]|nr:Na/Pi cotransporter family protein [Flavobacteriales bacterium]
MEFGFSNVIQILGSLAFFIYGMKLMSEGIQRAAGNQMRSILKNMTKNRFLGVFTGFIITALVQSSSATTVMTVSFVNAQLLSLMESAGVMMGANIGTTITGWLVSLLGFKVKLEAYSIPLLAIGVPMLFANKGKVKFWGEFIIGFAILFLGLNYLKDSVPDLKHNPEVLSWLQNFSKHGIFSRLFFVLVGTVLTIIIQSSSAAMAITLTMCTQGWLPLDVAAAMILGENIGTTITAELASLVGSTTAKRSARIHSLFNIIGVAWMVTILPLFLPLLIKFLIYIGFEDPTQASGMALGLSAFHTSFNTLNVMLLIGFVPWLVKLATKTVKEKVDEDSHVEKLTYISSPIITPELAITQLQRESTHFSQVAAKMNDFLGQLIEAKNDKERRDLRKKISKYESITDRIEIEIAEYITKLSDKEITPETSVKLRSFLNIANDLERIGDIYFQMAKTLERKNEEKKYFLPEQRENLLAMQQLIKEAFEIMIANVGNDDYDEVSKQKANELETKINKLRNKLRNHNLDLIGTENYDVETAMIYNNIFSSLERVGDHIINVTEAVVGEI